MRRTLGISRFARLRTAIPLPSSCRSTRKRLGIVESSRKDRLSEVADPDAEKKRALRIARNALRPSFNAALATLVNNLGLEAQCDILALVEALKEQIRTVNEGDLQRGEATLTAQAHTLDAIFSTLAVRAAKAEHLTQFEAYVKLALRAQTQCRATWEGISAIQNPPVAGYVNQANIAHGPQQVNNPPRSAKRPPHARENPKRKSKLLEKTDGERLDTGATGTAGEADKAMATVGEINGAKNGGR